MTSIIGYGDLIRSGMLDGSEAAEAGDYIVSEGKRLEILSMKLLDMIMAKNRPPVFVRTSPAELVRRLSEKTAPAYRERGIALEVRTEQGELLLEPDLVYCLLRNLVENAANAMPGTGGDIRITEQGGMYDIHAADAVAGAARYLPSIHGYIVPAGRPCTETAIPEAQCEKGDESAEQEHPVISADDGRDHQIPHVGIYASAAAFPPADIYTLRPAEIHIHFRLHILVPAGNDRRRDLPQEQTVIPSAAGKIFLRRQKERERPAADLLREKDMDHTGCYLILMNSTGWSMVLSRGRDVNLTLEKSMAFRSMHLMVEFHAVL